jgi:hypothetical protein
MPEPTPARAPKGGSGGIPKGEGGWVCGECESGGEGRGGRHQRRQEVGRRIVTGVCGGGGGGGGFGFGGSGRGEGIFGGLGCGGGVGSGLVGGGGLRG